MGGPIGAGPIPKGVRNEPEMERDLDRYDKELVLREKEIDIINNRVDIISSILNDRLKVKEKHFIGSYARDTIIADSDHKDIDLMIVLDKETHGEWLKQQNGPRNCLQYLKDTLLSDGRFKNLDISIDRNVVTIKYSNFSIDIVPAFKRTQGGYRIPDTYQGQGWIKTNPRMFKRIMSLTDRRFNNQLSKVVRIAKGWNENNGKPLKSFHIETIVYDHFKNQNKHLPLNKQVQQFFKALPWLIKSQSREPVYNERVDEYLDRGRRDIAIKSAKKAKKVIDKALRSQSQGKSTNYEEQMQKVFGSYYTTEGG